jgi:hypothetical protein
MRPSIYIMFFLLVGLAVVTTAGADPNTASASAPDSVLTQPVDPLTLRGLEYYKPPRGNGARRAANLLLAPPRLLLDGLLSMTAKGVYVVGDTDLIEHLEPIFTFYDRRIGWYPQISLTNVTKSAVGATLFNQRRWGRISLGGRYRNASIWNVKARVGRTAETRLGRWKLDLTAQWDNRDDYEFHGFGADPLTDDRNPYLSGAPESYGLFTQKIMKVQLLNGVRLSPDWEFIYSVFYKKRKVGQPNDNLHDNLANIYDLTLLPGSDDSSPQIYNEAALRYDSRQHEDRIVPGVRCETHLGWSQGVSGNESRFSRAGVDAALYIPILRRNRVVVPRIILDTVNNLNDAVPIAFTDYPRQRTFRGASSATLLRTDRISLTPSLEYQWPLTFNLSGHVFVDYLLVGESFGDLGFEDAPYAVGFGIDVRQGDAELARFSVAGGSEGLRALFSYGFSRNTNTRTKWR